MAIEIPLTRGFAALVDEADVPLLTAHRWRSTSSDGVVWYARTEIDDQSVFLHKHLTGYQQTDHINGNGLDNRRANLRQASNRQNQQNRVAYVGRTSRFKGVAWHSRDRRWRAQIVVDGRGLWLGQFADEVAAAHAYDAAAREHFGEFAALNFPRLGERGALLPQTGRPTTTASADFKLPAAVFPAAAAGTLPARATPVSSVSPDIRYWPGRAVVTTTPTATRG